MVKIARRAEVKRQDLHNAVLLSVILQSMRDRYQALACFDFGCRRVLQSEPREWVRGKEFRQGDCFGVTLSTGDISLAVDSQWIACLM